MRVGWEVFYEKSPLLKEAPWRRRGKEDQEFAGKGLFEHLISVLLVIPHAALTAHR